MEVDLMAENKTRPIFYTELSYLIGLVLLSFATALLTVANFGQSMIAAPAYLLHLRLSEYWPFFSFGMASYLFQAVLLMAMILLVRRFRISYLFSFVTAVLYGFLLDGSLLLLSLIPTDHMVVRVILYILGLLVCATGVALMFRSYVPPAVYELFVKELAAHFSIPVSRFKTAYDCSSCILSIVLSFCFYGFLHFEGIHVGTVICAAINGTLIGLIGKWLDSHFRFSDGLGLRRLFER